MVRTYVQCQEYHSSHHHHHYILLSRHREHFFKRKRRRRDIQKYITAIWVMGVRVAGLRPISKYSINVNSLSTIIRGRVAGLFIPISTSTTITNSTSTMIKYRIARGRVTFLLRPIYTSSITCRHSNTLIIRNTTVIAMVGVIMAGILIPIKKTSIITSIEISCLDVLVACTLFDYPLIGSVPLYWCYRWYQEMKWIRSKGSVSSGAIYQWFWELEYVRGEGLNGVGYKGSMAVR